MVVCITARTQSSVPESVVRTVTICDRPEHCLTTRRNMPVLVGLKFPQIVIGPSGCMLRKWLAFLIR